jgi:integrase
MYNVKNRYFHKCLERAKLRRVRFRDLRHTFASLLIQNGESLAYVKDQLGHASIKMTVDFYGHLVPGANRDYVSGKKCYLSATIIKTVHSGTLNSTPIHAIC